MIGTRSITTQAPSVNFTAATIASTSADRQAPMALITRPVRQPGSLSRRWCLVIPACDRVKLVNTPMA